MTETQGVRGLMHLYSSRSLAQHVQATSAAVTTAEFDMSSRKNVPVGAAQPTALNSSSTAAAAAKQQQHSPPNA